MDRDKLKQEIEDYLAWVDGMNLLTLDYDERAEGILSLLAPELEKAAKWDEIEGRFRQYTRGEVAYYEVTDALNALTEGHQIRW